MAQKNRNLLPFGVSYQHLPNHNTTIATLHGVRNNPSDIIQKLMDNSCKHTYCTTSAAYDYEFRDTYRAIAKVNTDEGDTYDEKTGEEIAHNRVMQKYYKAIDKVMCDYLEDLRSACAAFEWYMQKHNINYSKVSTVEEIIQKRYNGAKTEEQ